MAFESAFPAPLDHVADLIEIRLIVFASAGGMESSSHGALGAISFRARSMWVTMSSRAIHDRCDCPLSTRPTPRVPPFPHLLWSLSSCARTQTSTGPSKPELTIVRVDWPAPQWLGSAYPWEPPSRSPPSPSPPSPSPSSQQRRIPMQPRPRLSRI